MTRVVAAFCLLAAALPAGASELTPEKYRAEVEEVARSLERAWAQGPPHATAQALKALGKLPARADVGEPGGTVIAVDNRELMERLRADIESKEPAAVRRAADSVRALTASLEGPREAAGAHKARAAVAEVLRRREFRRTIWDRIRERLGVWLAKLQAWIARHMPEGRGGLRLGDVLAGLLIAAAVILAIVLAVSAVRSYRDRSPPAPAGEAGARRAERPRHVRDWLEEADALAGRGEFGEAVRALHMAALLRLDRLGLIEYHQSATDGRFLNVLSSRGRGDLSDGLSPLVALFERTWYGGREAGAGDYRRGRECWTQVEALAGA